MSETADAWKLYYWPGIKGRGEYVRLMFEEAGVPYIDVGNVQGGSAPITSDSNEQIQADPKLKDALKGMEMKEGMGRIINFLRSFKSDAKPAGFPLRAVPAIQKGDIIISNTPAIMYYLGEIFGWLPDSAEGRAYVNQVLAVVTDAVAEGRLAFHPKDFYASHNIQVEESKAYVKQYGETRLPLYLDYFETLLERNSAAGFIVGSSIGPADLAVYQYLAAAEEHYKSYYDAYPAPHCKAFKQRIEERPRIAAYLASDRCMPFDKDSMM